MPDAAPYLALADLFLEFYPLRAGTTPLEAAMAGLPVVALADLPADDPARFFHTTSPGLDERPVATTAEQFTLTVRRLVQTPGLRRREGDDVRAAVQALHDGPGWCTQLEAVYAHARSLPAVDVDDLGDSPVDERYGAMVLDATGSSQSPAPPPAGPAPRRPVRRGQGGRPVRALPPAHGALARVRRRAAGRPRPVARRLR